MSTRSWYPLLPLLALPLGACEGCIDLDGYRVVPAPDSGPSSGGAGGSSSVTCGTEEGALFVVSQSLGSISTASGVCEAGGRPGIDLVAIRPRDGVCFARAGIAVDSPPVFSVLSQVRHATGNTLAVAGMFAQGSLEFPLACSRSASVTLTPPPASAALFAARLRLDGSTFCTEWAHRAIIEDGPSASSLVVHAVEQADDGSVLMAGALGGALTRFEGGDRSSVVRGGAFFAAWTASGSLQGVTALATVPGAADATFALTSTTGSSPVVAGAAQLEDPACHACSGATHVTDAAQSCPVAPDAGRDAGDAASDAADEAAADASSEDAGHDAGDASIADAVADVATESSDGAPDAREPAPDTVNAFVLAPRSSGGCSRFESYGSDRVVGDAQAIFGLSRAPSACRVYATGVTGQDTWRTVGGSPRSTLPPNRDALGDAFLLRFGSGTSFGCTPSGPDFSLRISGRSAVTGEQVRAHCRSGVTATALVSAAEPEGPLTLERCTSADGCDAASIESTLAPLEPGLERQLVVLHLDDAGELRWNASFGPVGLDGLVRLGVEGAPRMDLALDRSDDVYVLFAADGVPRAGNVELTRCAELVENPAPGLWLIKLSSSGFGDRGQCRWARRLG